MAGAPHPGDWPCPFLFLPAGEGIGAGTGNGEKERKDHAGTVTLKGAE
jgi:hypothetical protein